MADIDDVLERLVTEPAFRERLAADPAAALAGYDLSPSDLALLASSVDDAGGLQRGVEQRTSKSAMVGLLASLTGGGGPGARGGGDCNDADVVQRSDEGQRMRDRPHAGEISVSRQAVGGDGGSPAAAGPPADHASGITFTFDKIASERLGGATPPGGGLDQDGAVDRVLGGRSVLPDTDDDGLLDVADRPGTDGTGGPPDVSEAQPLVATGTFRDDVNDIATPVPADDGGDGQAEAYKVREAAARTASPPEDLVAPPDSDDADHIGSSKAKDANSQDMLRTASPPEDLVAPPGSDAKHVGGFKWSEARVAGLPPEDFLTIDD